MAKSALLQRASEEAKLSVEQRLQNELRTSESLHEELRLCNEEMEKMDKVRPTMPAMPATRQSNK
jgi:hypothetical protein